MREAGRTGRPLPEVPLVLVDTIGGAVRVLAVNALAQGLGLNSGMTLADARAQIPDLRTETFSPQADAAFLRHLLHDFGRFTPMAARDGADGLILDVTGCTHLFGGEERMLRAVEGRAAAIGLASRLVLAGTPQAARALARFGKDRRRRSTEDRALVRRLPVAALELPDRDAQALRRAGLKTIGDVDDRPRSPLAARFGADFTSRLERILGLEDVRITPHRPVARVRADRILLEPITERQHVDAVIDELLADVEADLESLSLGGRSFALGLFRLDGHVRWIEVGLGMATRDPRIVARLFRERLNALTNGLDPGFGFDHVRMEVPRTEVLLPAQPAFDAAPSRIAALNDLTDRLRARLGPEAVVRVQPIASHLPERSSRMVSAIQTSADDASAWPERDPCSPPLRPLHLFDPPHPIEAIALAPDSPPARFRWRRMDHRVVLAEGPERIEGEWWRRRERVRDYYRVEDQNGRRFWVFRAGRFGEDPPPRWYLHGLFA